MRNGNYVTIDTLTWSENLLSRVYWAANIATHFKFVKICMQRNFDVIVNFY